MIIENVSQMNAYEHRLKPLKERKERERVSNESAQKFDKYIPTPQERAEQLSSIKNKIKCGYYNTDAVLEDLSHSFASALDKTV